MSSVIQEQTSKQVQPRPSFSMDVKIISISATNSQLWSDDCLAF